MRILAVGDLHGDLAAVDRALDRFRPDALACVGDWGDEDEVAEADLARLLGRLPAVTVFGNHDPLGFLGRLVGGDGRPALLAAGEVRDLGGIKVAGIGGIWAKSHRRPYYVTDEDVADQAGRIAANGRVDLLLTHACAVGLADQTPDGRRGGQRCFLLANQTISPAIHLCGHVHLAQERTLRDGCRVLNVGPTPDGAIVVIEGEAGRLEARLAQIDEPGGKSDE